ncbi:7143_t:CDS:2 [Entrophospora sp. SA101]|nr:7143_t:CDS:2 [Entrophospora sp. SA101]
MARPRQRRKIKNPSLKLSRKTSNKHFKKIVVHGDPIIASNWNKKETLRQNYKRIGLLTSLNRVAGERDDEGNIVNVIIGEDEDENEVFDKKIQPEPAKTEIVKALEEEASKVFKHEKYQSEGEIEFVKKMIERYGEDYDAMFKDIKLNVYQHTKKQLKKKCEKYLKTNS